MVTVVDCIDGYLNQLTRQQEFSGSVLVALNDNVLLKRGYGFARDDVKNTSETRFCIGSITKSFTANIILQLAQEGKLTVNDPVKDHLPRFFDNNITIYHLLTHTSGLPRSFFDERFIKLGNIEKFANSWGPVYLEPQLKSQYYEDGCSLTLASAPGQKFEYSNFGYQLLTKIVETVDGRPYGQSLQKRILDPLQMHSSTACSLKEWDNNDHVVFAKMPSKPAVIVSGPIMNAWFSYDDGQIDGDGSIVSTVGDLYTWAKEVASGEKLLNKEFYALFTSPYLNNYACGLDAVQEEDKSILGHDGIQYYFNAQMLTYRYKKTDDLVAVIVLANSWAEQIPRNIGRIFETKEAPVLRELSEFNDDDCLDAFVGSYEKENDSTALNVRISQGPKKTLWFPQGSELVRILKTDTKDCLGSNLFNFLVTFERNSENEVTGFVLDGKERYKKI